MATYGYRPSGNSPDLALGGPAGSDNYLAYAPDPMPENGWAYQVGVHVGPHTSGQTITQRIAILDSNNGNPDDVLVETASFNISTVMTDGSQGTKHVEDLTGYVRLFKGKVYPLATMGTGASGGYGLGMNQAATYPGRDNYLFYYANDSSFPMATPMPYYRTSYEGHMSIWATYEPNVAPDKPTGISPANGSTPSTLTPTLTANFRDDNESLPNGNSGDSLKSFDLEVRRVSDNTLMWALSDDSTSAERSARAFSRAVPSSTLSSGVAYKWRSRVYDQFGVTSAYTDWATFTVGAGSVSMTTGTPSGKQETQTPGPFTGKWTHSGALSTNAVRVRISDSVTGAAVRVSGIIAQTVANNGTISVTWAATGFSALPWGGKYIAEIQARDSANNWSGYSDPGKAFNINAYPTTPSQLTPSGGDAFGSRPVLTCKATDSDDTVAQGFTVKCYVREVGTNVTRGPYAMTLRTGTLDTWDLTTTSTHLPILDDYQWWAYSGDGTAWSGGVTVEANATLSTIASFTYANAPTVTITSPTAGSTITTDTPTFTWTTSSTQAVYRVTVDDTDTGVQLLNTGNVVSAAHSYTMPGGLIHNNGHYQLRVWITDSLALTGQSIYTAFNLTYTEPTIIAGFNGSPVYVNGDFDEPTGVILKWNASAVVSGFLYYNITRVPSDDTPVAFEDSTRSSRKVRVGRVANVAETSFIDDTAPSGVTCSYHIRQFVSAGTDVISSQLASVQVRLDFEHGVLQQVPQGGGLAPYRVIMAYRKDKRITRNRQTTEWQPMGKNKPLVFKGSVYSKVLTGTFILYGQDAQDADEMVRQLEYMDAGTLPLLWRDGRKRRFYCYIDSLEEIDPAGGRVRTFDMTLKEIDFTEIYES